MDRKLPLTAIAFLLGGIALGFVLGGLGPRRELETRDQEIARLERELESSGGGSGLRSAVPGLDRILRAPASEDRAGRAESEAGYQEPTPGADAGVGESWRERWREARSPSERFGQFQRAASVQRVRRIQSRVALQQQAELDAEQMRAIDEALLQMNDELAQYGEELVTLVMSEEPPPARDLLGVAHDVTGVMHRAQLRLEAIVGPEGAARADPSSLEIWNHVDLARLEPAARTAAGLGAP
ncbi:MAG: hypothetical protein IT378_18050 [Sandaracinaceae bacterium]|nr:hypothetical protein [Sandaracinaceae bacterium]